MYMALLAPKMHMHSGTPIVSFCICWHSVQNHLSWHYVEVMDSSLGNRHDSAPIEQPTRSRLGPHVALLLALLAAVIHPS